MKLGSYLTLKSLGDICIITNIVLCALDSETTYLATAAGKGRW